MIPDEISGILRAELRPKRFKHTMGVMAAARELAEIHGENEDKAQRAGLMHDNAKALSLEQMRRIAGDAGLEIGADESASASLMHAPVGAYLAKARFGEQDEEVLDAIRYHTTGRPGMSALEAIVYLADMIEPGRDDFEGLSELRKLARRDLFVALERGLYLSNSYVLERKQPLFERSAQAYEWIRHYNETRDV